jgi:hypothetical protein
MGACRRPHERLYRRSNALRAPRRLPGRPIIGAMSPTDRFRSAVQDANRPRQRHPACFSADHRQIHHQPAAARIAMNPRQLHAKPPVLYRSALRHRRISACGVGARLRGAGAVDRLITETAKPRDA